MWITFTVAMMLPTFMVDMIFASCISLLPYYLKAIVPCYLLYLKVIVSCYLLYLKVIVPCYLLYFQFKSTLGVSSLL